MHKELKNAVITAIDTDEETFFGFAGTFAPEMNEDLVENLVIVLENNISIRINCIDNDPYSVTGFKTLIGKVNQLIPKVVSATVDLTNSDTIGKYVSALITPNVGKYGNFGGKILLQENSKIKEIIRYNNSLEFDEKELIAKVDSLF